MGVWQGVAMNSLKFHLGLLCPTLLGPEGGPPLKQPYGHFKDGLPIRRVACSALSAHSHLGGLTQALRQPAHIAPTAYSPPPHA
jgi:hypothetical protein